MRPHGATRRVAACDRSVTWGQPPELVSAGGLLGASQSDGLAEMRAIWPGACASKARGPQVVFCLTCSQTLEITTDPSPTAEATRFTDPARTSPTAKMPG